ncbi:MAG: T9SS type A sorting domain-containing protein [Bacteroidota bacterium]
MRPTITLLVFVLFSCLTLTAQTEVNGGVFTETTWTADASPYVVTGEVVVFPGASLTIEPGVTVRFQTDLGIELRTGSIYANGTADAPIIFTLDEENPSGATTWSGIRSTTDLGLAIDREFSHVVIEYAALGIRYAGGGYRFLDNATLRNNVTGLEAAMDQGYDWVTITNSEIHDNEMGTLGRVTLENCNVYNNVLACGDIYSFSNGSEGGRISNCTFTNNAICFTRSQVILASAYIDNSTFIDNNVVANAYRIEATNSTFSGSTVHSILAGTGTIENCFFTGNAIAIKTTEAPYEQAFRNNIFDGNEIAIQIEGAGAEISGNTICNNSVFNVIVRTSDNVDLTNNCWCTPSEDDIALTIYDAFDNVSAGIATFVPFEATCVQGLQYPGDANNNGIANAWDVLALGLHYGTTGHSHENLIFEWAGHEALDWGTQMVNGDDLKHIDTNGDGVIDEMDMDNIQLNYRRTHTTPAPTNAVHEGNTPFPMAIVAPEELLGSTPASFAVTMGDAANPVDNCYGIAFALVGDTEFYEPGSFYLDLTDSWLGTADELLTMIREFPDENRLEVAIVRKDGAPRSGIGEIASLNGIMIEDLIISLDGIVSGGGPKTETSLQLSLEAIEAVTNSGAILATTTSPTEITLTDVRTIADQIIRLYPNPATDHVWLDTGNLTVDQLELYNATGVRVRNLTNATQPLSTRNLAPGLYFLRISANGKMETLRLMIQ